MYPGLCFLREALLSLQKDPAPSSQSLAPRSAPGTLSLPVSHSVLEPFVLCLPTHSQLRGQEGGLSPLLLCSQGPAQGPQQEVLSELLK